MTMKKKMKNYDFLKIIVVIRKIMHFKNENQGKHFDQECEMWEGDCSKCTTEMAVAWSPVPAVEFWRIQAHQFI